MTAVQNADAGPSWAREIATTVRVTSHYRLYGNVEDRFLAQVEGETQFRTLAGTLADTLSTRDIRVLIEFDVTRGAWSTSADGEILSLIHI